jgi:hypothetical protein
VCHRLLRPGAGACVRSTSLLATARNEPCKWRA